MKVMGLFWNIILSKGDGSDYDVAFADEETLEERGVVLIYWIASDGHHF